jgi:hypothetical protein
MNIKQQADSYVEMFKTTTIQQWDQNTGRYVQLPIHLSNRIDCAIIHVEWVMRKFEEIAQMLSHNPYSTEVLTQFWSIEEKVLTELKSRI